MSANAAAASSPDPTSTVGTAASSGTTPSSCRNGHLRIPENTYIRPDGHKQCRICKTASTTRSNRTNKWRTIRKREWDQRYNQSAKGRWRRRRYRLKKLRQRTQAQLDQLSTEEEELNARYRRSG